jgi:predicted pyridoxine 5'-phosphate oxidase superfamily flavin-nucleotide-binding protein
LRINGSARILADADYFDALTVKGRRPLLAMEIDIEEVFFHCAKAFLRSETWDPSTWDPTAVPSVAKIAKATIREDWSVAQLEEYYREDNVRTRLY